MTEFKLKHAISSNIREIADHLISYYNPCDFSSNRCRVASPSPCCAETRYGSPCPHLIAGKCSMPNTECRLWFCRTAMKEMDPVCLEAFRILEKLAILFKLIEHPYLGEPYPGIDNKGMNIFGV